MRKINKIIIHSTATPEGRHHTVEDITKWHLARPDGFITIGYHFVVYLDGSVHKGRDIEMAGAHCPTQNSNSIGIVYVGGCDKNMKPKDTRTPEQKAALLKLVKELRAKYPEVTIHGHRDFKATACPSFDVHKETWT